MPRKVAEAHLKEAKEKLEHAKKLYEDSYYDDSARNGYYSMYHAARVLLELKDSKPKSHRGVISEVQRLYVNTNKLGQDLLSALSRDLQVRIQVDYDTMIEISEDVAKEVLEDARTFLAEVESVIAREFKQD